MNQNNKGFALVLLLIIIVVIAAVGVFGYSSFLSGSSNPLPAIIARNPYDKLNVAIDKTNSAKTLYLEFDLRNKGEISLASGVTQPISGQVTGHQSGSTDGEVMRALYRFHALDGAGSTLNVSLILLENGDAYVQAPGSSKWTKTTTEELAASVLEGSTDASIFAETIVGTIFSSEKAFFKAINKNSVVEAGEEGNISKYSFEISVPDFLTAYGQDPDVTEPQKNDARKILQDAVLQVTASVDNTSNYITKIVLNAKNLTLLLDDTTQVTNARLNSEYTAVLSRFDVPTNITAPDPSDVLGASTTRIQLEDFFPTSY